MADECVTRSILTTTLLEGHNCVVYRKPDFMFGNQAPDIDQQLLAREGQWIFTVEDEKYYLPSSKRHFSLSYFQSVMTSQKMGWSMTQSIDSVHVEILKLNGYNHYGSPRAVLSMHPGKIGQDLLVGENLAMAQTFLNQFIKVHNNYSARDFKAPGWALPVVVVDGLGALCLGTF